LNFGLMLIAVVLSHGMTIAVVIGDEKIENSKSPCFSLPYLGGVPLEGTNAKRE